jgi:protease secretion system membrane fusion protein
MSSMANTQGAKRPARDIVTDIEGTELNTDTRGPIRIGFWVLLLGFGGFLLWASIAPLDEGVSAPATVSIETKRRSIQHMNGGVVQTVLVKEGQMVKEGDVLMELGDAQVKANFESVRQNYLAQRAAESRALAELQGRPTIEFHKDLLAGAVDPFVKQHMATQTQLFNARRAALESDQSASRESIAGLQAQVQGYDAMLENRKAQIEFQAEQLRSVRELSREGYASRNQVLQLEQTQAELRSTLADLQASRTRASQSIAETRMRMAQRREEYNKESSAQLAEVRREVQAQQERLTAVTEELKRVSILTPVDGQVVGMTVTAVGGVVSPGQRLMDIVPQDSVLLLDAKIPPHTIDRIRVGDPVDVRFSAFSHSPQLMVPAKLVSLSHDALTDPQGAANAVNTPYYLGRVEVTQEGVGMLGSRAMQPGMQAEVLVRTGARSLLTYLLHPLTKRVAQALKEE